MQITVSIVGGMIPICLGIYVFAVSHLFWSPLFLIALGISIILFINGQAKAGFYGLGIVLILFVIVHFVEPKWIDLLVKQVS